MAKIIAHLEIIVVTYKCTTKIIMEVKLIVFHRATTLSNHILLNLNKYSRPQINSINTPLQISLSQTT